MKRLWLRSKVIVIVLALLALTVSACTDKEPTDDSAGSGEQTETGKTGNAHASDKSTWEMSAWPDAEFTVFHSSPSHQVAVKGAPIVEQVYERTKVRLNIEVPPSNIEEKLNIMLAGQEYPDVILIYDPVIGQRFVDAGYVIPLDDLIGKYGDQIQARLGDTLDQLRRQDGHIYHLPSSYVLPGADRMLEVAESFQMLTSVLEDKGWPKPETYSDIYQLLTDVKQNYPEYVPMSLALGDEPFFNSLIVSLAGAEGVRLAENGYVWTEDDRLVYRYKDERLRNSFRWLNRLYREGLIDQESLVQNRDSLNAKMSAATVFSTIGHWYFNMYEANTLFNQEGEPYRYKYFIIKSDTNGGRATYVPYANNYDYGFYVTDKMRDPVRFMQFVNWMYVYDNILSSSSVVNFDGEDAEGYDVYVTDENGVQVVRNSTYQINGWQTDEAFAAKRGYGNFEYLTYSLGGTNHPSYTYKLSMQDQDISVWWDEEQKRINAAYGESGTYWVQEGIDVGWDSTDVSGLTVDPDSEEYGIIARIQPYSYNEIVKLIAAPTAEAFESGYDDFLRNIEDMGISKWENLVNRLYEERKQH